MQYDKKHDIECQLDRLIDGLISFKEGIDHHEGVIDVINVGDKSDYALDNARKNLAYCREGLEAAEIEYYAVKKQLAWYEFIDAESTPVDDSWQTSLISTPQSKTDNLLKKARSYRMFNVSPYSFGKAGTDYNNKKANEFDWLAFMEAN